MLSKLHRFHGYGSLRAAYQHGQTVRGPLITLKYKHRGSGRTYRVAVVVSRKVNKSAVVRNRLRRRVYEAVRLNADLIPAGTDLVFTVFSDQAAKIDGTKLQATIQDLLKKAG